MDWPLVTQCIDIRMMISKQNGALCSTGASLESKGLNILGLLISHMIKFKS